MPVSKQKLGTWEQWLEISIPAMGCIPIQRKPYILFEQPGVDCLALSYGSSHGDYPAGYRPAFRFDIVQTIKEATDLPLVLHGGSGAGRENILRSVALGINKINVGADFMKAQRNALHQQLDACPESDYPTLIHQTIEAGKAVVKEYIELSGSKNKSL